MLEYANILTFLPITVPSAICAPLPITLIPLLKRSGFSILGV